ncbi:hypothetical protein [Capnocytophaga bilenii]
MFRYELHILRLPTPYLPLILRSRFAQGSLILRLSFAGKNPCWRELVARAYYNKSVSLIPYQLLPQSKIQNS